MNDLDKLIDELGLLPTREDILKVHKSKHGFPFDPDKEFYKDLWRAALCHALKSGKLAVLNGEGIKEIPCGAANTQNYTASGVGMSWERTAPIFEAFKNAGYRPVKLIKEVIK